MKTLRDAQRIDIEEQFELPHMPPPMTVRRAKDFTCEPNSSACDECRRLFKLKLTHSREVTRSREAGKSFKQPVTCRVTESTLNSPTSLRPLTQICVRGILLGSRPAQKLLPQNESFGEIN